MSIKKGVLFMNAKFVYDIPTKVYFGENQLSHLAKELQQFGKKVLMIYGKSSIKKIGLYDKIMDELKDTDLEIFEYSGIDPNPRHTSINEAAELCRKEKIDVLLAVGGGSTIDAAKLIGTSTFYEGDSWDIVKRKVPATNTLPIVSILTLSATGSEMDCGGVITNLDTKEKIGFATPSQRPRVSFLDPTNTYSVSAFQTASGSADIFSHVIEVYFNMNPDLYMLDTVMEGLLKTVIKYAPKALANPTDYEARANLMWASSWAINDFVRGGKQLAWSCHPMEHQLSAYYDITHGLGLAILTPRWMKYVLDESTVSRFYQYGTEVFGIDKSLPPMEVAEEAIRRTENFLFTQLGLKSSLTEVGIDREHFTDMAKKACNNATLAGFKPLQEKDIVAIYEMCL